MLFNSVHFLIFFIILYVAYISAKCRIQNILLLVGGWIFYSFWDVKMSFLLLFSIIFNFYLGKKISISNVKKHFLVFGIVVNLLILIIFKYTLFLSHVFNDVFLAIGQAKPIPILSIVLPVGISFYTFHNISYIVDVYKNRILPTNSIITFSIYDLFFPLLLAGPIERAENLIPQIEEERKLNFYNFYSGGILFVWGIFKKVFVADNLSGFVNASLDPNNQIPEGMIYYSAFCFAFQVYADFSGYTDAARGLAKMMGFRLSHNFLIPFISSNPSEFWKRWHISLSTWLRDYLYIPLGGNRIGLFRQNINLIIVWVIGGLWHGATYGYLIWGFYCGIQIVLYNLLFRYASTYFKSIPNFVQKFTKYVGVFLTFWLFALGLLLFRVENLFHLERILTNLSGIYFSLSLFLKIIFFISPIIVVQSFQLYKKEMEILNFKSLHPLVLISLIILFSVQFSLFGVFEHREFFYFQF
ncbi:MAG: MBOAT family protein [Leptospiraceae bacterium]|nr:MBOAT family protein [Leptospiraceae bacterium]MCK6381410.1 MBOAT family protein [Leptospiraceae bacterium]